MPYTPIIATLGYALSRDRSEVLMIHRNARPDDLHYGKHSGLGGKLERNEDVVSGMRRELLEEAGIEAVDLQLRGTISWPGFGKNGEDWLAFIFLITGWQGTPSAANHEGALEWVPLQRVLDLSLNLWPGDRYFLPLVFGAEPRQFHGVMPYRDGQPLSWSYTLI
ncbi:MAG: 8-oxo-dGTP diphosphatase [Chloroflexi bacterium]|nr:8-oxo-dGTP diphosphatase [Chloroflexota bacterium]MCL5274087.1 8-oxo-dGTP diphosphatase [Chloroflexota bacterium]